MIKKGRKEFIRKRKNFFPTLVVTVLLWISLLVIIYFVDPFFPGALILFFLILFFCLVFSFSIVFGESKNGIIFSLAAITFLILRYLGIGNIINFVLISGIALSLYVYFR